MGKKIENIYECLEARLLLDQVADKWSMLVLGVLANGPTRFNQIKVKIQGVSQKSLSQCLRGLERSGLIERNIIDGNVLGVEYSITTLGESLSVPFESIFQWVRDNSEKIKKAEKKYDDSKRGRL